MSLMRFFCPKTGGEIEPDIDAVAIHGATVRFTALHVRCPHCGEHHEIKIDDQALDEAA